MKKVIKVENPVMMEEIVTREDKESMPISYEDLTTIFNKMPNMVLNRPDFIRHTFSIRASKKQKLNPTFDLFFTRCLSRLGKNSPFKVLKREMDFSMFIIEKIRDITKREMEIISMPKSVWDKIH